MEERNGSTTPPLPPPESTEIVQTTQQQQSSPAMGPSPTKDQAASAPLVEMAGQQLPVDAQTKNQQTRRPTTKTPEPLMINSRTVNGLTAFAQQQTPSTPGTVTNYDWDDLESRFEQALTDANEHEKELLAEFEHLVKYFNVWASAASAHDNERATKRLQTRTQYVKIQEQSLDEKKQHYDQVMKAFHGAMALLSRP